MHPCLVAHGVLFIIPIDNNFGRRGSAARAHKSGTYFQFELGHAFERGIFTFRLCKLGAYIVLAIIINELSCIACSKKGSRETLNELVS